MSIISKMFLRRLLEFEVIESIPGRVRLKSKAPENIYRQVEPYEEYLKRAILIMDGIDEVELNYNTGSLFILYDTEKTMEDKILKWVNKITEIGVENQELIEEYSNKDIKYLEMLLEQELKEEIAKL